MFRVEVLAEGEVDQSRGRRGEGMVTVLKKKTRREIEGKLMLVLAALHQGRMKRGDGDSWPSSYS